MSGLTENHRRTPRHLVNNVVKVVFREKDSLWAQVKALKPCHESRHKLRLLAPHLDDLPRRGERVGIPGHVDGVWARRERARHFAEELSDATVVGVLVPDRRKVHVPSPSADFDDLDEGRDQGEGARDKHNLDHGEVEGEEVELVGAVRGNLLL